MVQNPHCDVKTKRPQPVKLDLPLFQCPSAGIILSLPSSMADFVPCDRLLQKAHLSRLALGQLTVDPRVSFHGELELWEV